MANARISGIFAPVSQAWRAMLARTSSRSALRYAAFVSIIILFLELAVFNMGTWMSPHANDAQACILTPATSTTPSATSPDTRCAYTLQHATVDTKTANAKTRHRLPHTTSTTIATTSAGAQLTLSVPRSQPLQTLELTPSSAVASSFSTEIILGSKQFTYYSDRPTFIFIPREAAEKAQKTGKLTLHFTSPASQRINLGSITLNAHRKFRLSFIRVAIFTLFAVLLWILRPRSPLYRIQLDTHSKAQRRAFWLGIVVPLVLLGAGSIAIGGIFVGQDSWHEPYNYVYSYHHYILAAQSLLEGHPWVDLPVDSLFASLPNPYSPVQRDTILNVGDSGATIYWDYAFFNSHWYSYFAILPTLAVYLPFHFATGGWPSIFAVTTFLLVIALIFTCATVIRFIHHFAPSTSVGHTIIAVITTFVGFNFLALILTSNLYIVAFSSALCVVSIGLFIWFGLDAQSSWKRQLLRMAAGTFFISLSINCRPTFIFAGILVLPVFLEAVTRMSLRKIISAVGINILAAAPSLALALWYNWWRFENPLDFGSQYQITVTDITALQPAASSLAQAMGYYLFTPLRFTHTFPFIDAQIVLPNPWIHREAIIAGLFALAPLILCALVSTLVPRVWKAIRLRGRFFWLYPPLALGVGIFLTYFVSKTGGIAWRYFADFSWGFTFAALPALIVVCNEVREHTHSHFAQLTGWALTLLTMYQLIITFATIFAQHRFASLAAMAPQLFAGLVQAFTIF